MTTEFKYHTVQNVTAVPFNPKVDHPKVKKILDIHHESAPIDTYWFVEEDGDAHRVNSGDWIVSQNGRTILIRKEEFAKTFSPGWIEPFEHTDAGLTSKAVFEEAERAMKLHAPMASRHHAYAVILEELDEFWDLAKKNPAKMSQFEAEDWVNEMKKELIQTAAMCVRAVVDLKL